MAWTSCGSGSKELRLFRLSRASLVCLARFLLSSTAPSFPVELGFRFCPSSRSESANGLFTIKALIGTRTISVSRLPSVRGGCTYLGAATALNFVGGRQVEKALETPPRHLSIFHMEIRAVNRRYVAVEKQGGCHAKPDSVLKAFIYAHFLNENHIEKSAEKRMGCGSEKSVYEPAC